MLIQANKSLVFTYEIFSWTTIHRKNTYMKLIVVYRTVIILVMNFLTRLLIFLIANIIYSCWPLILLTERQV